MDLIKQQGNVIKQVGSGLVAPGISDAISRVVDTVTGDAGKSQDEKIAALEAEVAAGRKTKQQAQAEVGMKKKLTSAKTANDPDSRINKSLRAWNCKEGGAIRGGGCEVRGKTKGKMV